MPGPCLACHQCIFSVVVSGFSDFGGIGGLAQGPQTVFCMPCTIFVVVVVVEDMPGTL